MKIPGQLLFDAPLTHEISSPSQFIDASIGPNLLSANQLALAVTRNRHFATQLWRGLYDPISIYYLRYRYMIPVEEEFVQAVARWQRAVGLKVDGQLGPYTWRVMRHRGEPDRYITPDGIVRPSNFSEVVATFGDPRPTRPPSTKANPLWERGNIVLARAPVGFTFHAGASRPRSVQVHRLLKNHFESLFRTIALAGLWEAIQPWGGSYNFRPVRGGTQLSMHAFAIAVDINPAAFPRGQNQHIPDPRVVQIFQDYGFHWGIFWGTPDPMHFQFATGA